MNWIALSLLAPVLFTFVVFIDQYVITKRVKNTKAMPIYSAITALVLGTIVWLLASRPNPGLYNGLLLLMAGSSSLLGYVLYFYALARSQTSYVIALLQTGPLFTLLLSTLVLHTRLSLLELGGFFLIFIAVLGLSLDPKNKKIKLTKSFYAVLLANALFAVSDVIIKFTIGLNGFVPIFVYESWGVAIAGVVVLLLSKSIRQAFSNNVKTVQKSTLGIMFFNEGLFIASRAITFLAIAGGPVALVVVLGGTQVFYGLLLGLILTWLFPRIFHEDTAKKDVLRKAGFTVLLFSGIACIAVA